MVFMFLASCSSWPVAVQGVRSFLAHKMQPEQIQLMWTIVVISQYKVVPILGGPTDVYSIEQIH